MAGLSFAPNTAGASVITVIACDPSSSADEIDLQNAVHAANDETNAPGGDTIHLGAGCTYTFTEPAVDGLPDAIPAITSQITFEGHGSTIEMGPFNPDMSHIFRVEDTGNLTVRQATLRNAIGPPGIGGAAIYNIGTTHIDESTITDNHHGAVFNYWGKLMTVTDSTFTDNDMIVGDVAGGSGGGAINSQGRLIVSDSNFTDNAALRGGVDGYHSGGAIYLGDEAVGLITDSTFHSNGSTNHGGAIFSFAPMTITDSVFTQNSNFQAGGAVFAWGETTISRSYFGQNIAGSDGGAVYAAANLTVRNSTFWRNRADDGGGAIKNQSANLLSITGATFAENVSEIDEGDAVYQSSTSTGTTKNSLFDGHTSACFQLQSSGGNMVDEFDPSCSGSFLLADPKLQAPAMNGGDTPTMKLGAGSQALDRIQASDCTSTTTDQRQQPRPAGTRCDVGAFEDQIPTTPGTPSITAGGPSPSNVGSFTISWSAASDPDGPVTYRLQRRDADDAAWTQVASGAATSAAVTQPEGTSSYRVIASDGNHEVTSSSLVGVVVDTSAPGAATVTPDRGPDYAPDGGTAWYLDTVTVTITANGDPALPDGSPGSGVASVTSSPTFATSGEHTASGVVTDAAGNSSTATNLTVHVDATDPVAAFDLCPSTVLLAHAAEASWTASDAHSGLATPASGSIALDTATIGSKTVSTTATDNVGQDTTVVCAYDVIYDFTGFFAPVANAPTITPGSAGRVITVAFSLAGNQGMGVIASGYPQSVEVPCTAFGEHTTGSPTTAVKPGLSFSSGSGGRYQYPWKTQSSWRGTCRQLIVKLDDGTYHRANLQF